jgi:N6-adenosine-specific RNA methylase IME4
MRRYRQRLKRSRPDPKTVAKQQKRAEREAALAAATLRAAETLGTKLYNVLYVDIPSDFEVWSRVTGMDRHAANHYPVMSFEALKAIKLPAAKDCVLFFWTTVPLDSAGISREIIAAWGFTCVSQYVWEKIVLNKKDEEGDDKIKTITGYWNRNAHEILLIATRGAVPCPAPGTQYPSVIRAPTGDHSEKPEIFAKMIEDYFPTTPKLEMFARKPRDGWDSWGNEVIEAEAA